MPKIYANAAEYWEERYVAGVGSGVGSRGEELEWKVAEAVRFARDIGAKTVLDVGCGDGHFGRRFLEEMPEAEYAGIDFSPEAARLASEGGFPVEVGDVGAGAIAGRKWDLVLCLDVLYHALSQEAHDRLVDGVFAAATKGVLILTWGKAMDGVPVAPHNCYWPLSFLGGAQATVRRALAPNKILVKHRAAPPEVE